jgi:hypothetical protein
MRDVNRTFEVSGVAGGQRVFYYDADTVNHVLYLQDKIRVAGTRDDAPGAGNPGVSGTRRRSDAAASAGPPARPWIPEEARRNIGDEFTKVHPLVQTTRRKRGLVEESKPLERNKLILNYQTTDGNRVVLRGVVIPGKPPKGETKAGRSSAGSAQTRDSIYVVLDRIQRPYALTESTLKAGRY